MKWLVCYDIEKDSLRQKIADFCLDKGLERVQYSVFLGNLSHTLARDLAAQVRRKLGRNAGQVRFIPICEKDWKDAFIVQAGERMRRRAGDG